MGGKTVVVTEATFEQQVLRSDKPVMVDFWAPWCPPCRAVAPVLENLAGEYDNRAMIAKVNTDEHPSLMMKYGIMGLPTMIIFKDGQPVDRIEGAGPKAYYTTRLDRALQEGVAAR